MMIFSSTAIDLNDYYNNKDDNKNNNNNNNNDILSSTLSSSGSIDSSSDLFLKEDYNSNENSDRYNNNNNNNNNNNHQHNIDHPEKSQIIFESTKLRHFSSGNNNNNEHNYFGKHESSRRKFRSASNNTLGKANVTSTLSSSLPSSSSLTSSEIVKRLNDDVTLAKAPTAITTTATISQQQAVQGFRIEGFRIEHSKKEAEFGEDGVPEVLSRYDIVLRLFGYGFTDNLLIIFTTEENTYGGSCLIPSTGRFRVIQGTSTNKTALVEVSFDRSSNNKDFLICAKLDDSTENIQNVTIVKPFVHQGSEAWLRIRSVDKLLPLWASVAIIIVCLTFSALFSGLNLGLMALDRTELKILRNTGTDKEREYASKIQPVRDHGNFLLCSILLGNVLVNSMFTILLDDLTSGLVAVICSTLAIVVFGEITPQAICSRHGLAVGAKTIYITKAVMVVTFPLSYPTSKILDYMLGEEIGNVYNRERLKELVRVTNDVNDLDKNEVNIISGALELRKKTVKDIMTHIEDAFMLSLDAILDFETVSEIMKSGFSRIPVYDGDRKNIVTLLYIKDLAFVDPDDNTPLKTLCEFYQNPCHFVFEDVTLDIMFNQFKEGNKGHMAFVHRVNSEGDGDPFYETIGLVTLEDVIEELIQAEIIDETDVFIDNRTKRKRFKTKKQDFTVFAERRENQRIHISPQLTLATFQYLSTSIDAFKKDTISETILRRLLNQDIIKHIKCKGKEKDDPSLLIYEQGKPVDFFVLILEGRVEVTVGRENLVFESGPFTYFGTQALVPNIGIESPSQQSQQIMGSLQSLNMDALLRHSFVPDYSVRATADVIYITIKRSLYLAAKRATLLEKSQKLGVEPTNEAIDDEVEKLLHSLDEDDRYTAHFQVNRNNDLNASNKNLSNMNLNEISTNTNIDNHSKQDSNSPSPTFPSDCLPNGPTPISPNSLQTSFNQHTASLLGSQQTSNNSMAVALSKSPSGGGNPGNANLAHTDNNLLLPCFQIQNSDDLQYNSNNGDRSTGLVTGGSVSGVANRASIGEIGVSSSFSSSAEGGNLPEIKARKKSLNINQQQNINNSNNSSNKSQKLQSNMMNLDSSNNTADAPLLKDDSCIQYQQQQQTNNPTNRKNSKC